MTEAHRATPPKAARTPVMQLLPDELLYSVVAACARPETYMRIASTSWRLYRLCQHFDEALWRPLCFARFPRLHSVVAAAASSGTARFSYRDLFWGELVAELTPATANHLSDLPKKQQVLDQFVVSMELHISATKLEGVRFSPEPTPSQETPGLFARWTGRIDELSQQRFWTADAMPHWLQPEATCDTFSRVQLVVYLTWLRAAPRTLKLYHGEYAEGNDDGFGLTTESLGCGPDECSGRTLEGQIRVDLLREAGMKASVAEADGHVTLEFGYASPTDEDLWMLVEGKEQQARFMAMHFPCLPWPPLPRRRLKKMVAVPPEEAQTQEESGHSAA